MQEAIDLAAREEARKRVLRMSPEKRVEFLNQFVPRLPPPYIPHAPHPPQALYLCAQNLEAFYGGAAGGGKSDALLMAALQYVDVPGYSALIIRRSFQDLTLPGAIMDRAWDWLAETDAKPIAGGRAWKFPSGARLTFGYVQYHRDVEQYRGAEFQFIGMDEVTYWDEVTYQFLFSRLRRPAHPFRGEDDPQADDQCNFCGEIPAHDAHSNPPELMPSLIDDKTTVAHVPLRMRAASNPGGRGHKWVKERFVDGDLREPGAAFVPARLVDNPSLDRASYVRALSHLDAVERERLLYGDWEIMPEGALFRRHWFEVVEEAPADALHRSVRYWDLAATNPARNGQPSGDPDWSVGVRLGYDRDGVWYVIDVQRLRGTPLEVERMIRQTAELDGTLVSVWMEQEGGSAGVNTIDRYRRDVLRGFDFHSDSPRGSKSERAKPMSASAESGNFKLVRRVDGLSGGQWISEYLDECELFPFGAHDDQVDATTGAMKVQTLYRKRPAGSGIPRGAVRR